MRRSRWTRRILIVLAALVIGVTLRLTAFRPSPVPVTIYRVNRGRVEDTVVNSRAGTLKSRLRAQMSPGIAGLVAKIPAEKGHPVRAGQVLLQLDDREYRAQVELADRSLDAARASADQVCLTGQQAVRDLTRATALAGQHLLSDQGLEDARTKAQTLEAACVAARQQVKQAQAALDAARATLAKTAMIAPFDGVVLDITTQVGEWISPSPPGVFIPPVIDLINLDSLYVSAPLDEADVSKIRVGLPVRITMDALRGQSFPGTLSYVSSFVVTKEEQNRTLEVEAVFDGGHLPANVLPGLSSDIEVILGARDNVLRIPTYALLEGDLVLLVKKDRLESVKVVTGLHNWELTEVTAGLNAGDRIVVSLDRPEVKSGARVQVTGETQR